MGGVVRDPTDELAVFSVPLAVLELAPDLRDDYCYWPLVAAIAGGQHLVPLGPVRDLSLQFLLHPDDAENVVLRHPCQECRAAVSRAVDVLAQAEPGSFAICVAQCVVDYLGRLDAVHGRFSPIMRTPSSL